VVLIIINIQLRQSVLVQMIILPLQLNLDFRTIFVLQCCHYYVFQSFINIATNTDKTPHTLKLLISTAL
jgi:hypothetical protein